MTAQAAPGTPPPVRPAGLLRRHALLWLVAGIFAAYIVTNGVMLYVATRTPPALVSQSYYEDSRGYDAVQNAETATAAAGWRVTVTAAEPAAATVRIQDRAGRPASGFSGEVSAYRPNDAGLDQTLAWSEDAGQPGLYHARFARPKAGQWQLQLSLRRGGERLFEELRVVTP